MLVNDLFSPFIDIFGVVYGVFGRGCDENFGYLRYFASTIASGAGYLCRTVASSTIIMPDELHFLHL